MLCAQTRSKEKHQVVAAPVLHCLPGVQIPRAPLYTHRSRSLGVGVKRENITVLGRILKEKYNLLKTQCVPMSAAATVFQIIVLELE